MLKHFMGGMVYLNFSGKFMNARSVIHLFTSLNKEMNTLRCINFVSILVFLTVRNRYFVTDIGNLFFSWVQYGIDQIRLESSN
jgi:hypothetical protein